MRTITANTMIRLSASPMRCDNSRKAVVNNHEQNDGDERCGDRLLAFLHGDAAERRTDDVLADRSLVERGRQAARIQDFDRRFNFLVAHRSAADHALAFDLGADNGRVHQHLVENDAQMPINFRRGRDSAYSRSSGFRNAVRLAH